MEITLLLIALILLIWIGVQVADSGRRLKDLGEEVKHLRRDLKGMSEEKKQAEQAAAITAAPPPVEPPPVAPRPVAPRPAVHEHPVPLPPPQPSAYRRWLLDNPDIERFIGENLINKIGIGILVLGIAFFVKYAIDQEWIGETGRVCIGLFCGALLLAVAHRLRKGYHSFSSVLVGGGICVFYFTVAFAFHQYKLVGQGTAFASVVVITVFAILLSVLYDRLELGVLASLGGFVTPFLVSNGTGNYEILFTYLCILNAGLIILAYYKRWRLLNFLAFFFTETIFLGWIVDKAGSPGFPYVGLFVFGAVFYGMFLVMNIIHHAAQKSPLKAFDFIILLSVNLAFYGAGVYLLQKAGYESMKGLFTLCLGLINLLLTYLFLRQKAVDRNFVYLLLGITLSFLSLTVPIQLKGHYITLFWGTEIVVLFWLYQKSFIRLIKAVSAIITALMLVSLFIDWGQTYATEGLLPAVIINKGFITGLFCACCMTAYYRLARKEGGLYFLGEVTNRIVRSAYLGAAILLIFISGFLEIYVQFSHRLKGTGLEFAYLQLFCVVFGILLFLLLQRMKIHIEPLLALVAPLLLFILYMFNMGNTYDTEVLLLRSGLNREYFLANWASASLLLVLGGLLLRHVRKNPDAFQRMLMAFSWALTTALVILLSVETMHLFLWLCYKSPSSISEAEETYGKAGLSILWGVCSFLFIAIGMSYRYKPLRIIALVLFGVTILKLFCYDISNISPAGKIIAFILLGVLLLIISFMYQRLKRILLNDPGSAA